MIDFTTIQKLQSLNRWQFAHALENLTTVTAQEHSHNLFSYQTQIPLEQALQTSFEEYFAKTLSLQDAKDALYEIQTNRILQTTTHTTVSEGATFFATHWLASCYLKEQRPYLVATFSGVPFSNSAWSGCLNYGFQTDLSSLLKPDSRFFKQALRAENHRNQDCNDKRLSLIEGKMRDSLVYQSKIPVRLLEIIQDLQSPLLDFIPQIQTESFTTWVTHFSQNLLRKLMPHVRSIYFDINQIISNYLIQILQDKTHAIYQMLYGLNTDNHLSKINLFCCPSPNGQKVMQIKKEQLPQNANELCEKILKNRWCPAPFLVFTVLAGINQFCCLGGFEQIEYFAKFQKIWQYLEGINAPNLQPQQMLTTARFVDSQNLAIFPLDLIVNEQIKSSWHLPKKEIATHALMNPIVQQILSTNFKSQYVS